MSAILTNSRSLCLLPVVITAFCLLPHFITTVEASPLRSRAVTNTSKAGLGWGGGDAKQYTTTGKVSWYYTWGPEPVEADNNLEFVPMLWGQRQVDQFTSTINQTIGGRNITAILGMNEPQEKGQSNLTPQEGAAMWKQYIEPLRALHNVRLGSPAPSGAPSGKIWIQDFLTACAGGCTVDFIAMHYYDVNATDFKEYLEDFHTTFQKPLWITEWACQNFNDVKLQCSPDDIALFLNATQSFMDQTDYVERYAWFGAMPDTPINKDTALMDSNGNINGLGKQYTGEEPPKTTGSGNADGPTGGGSGNNAANSLRLSTSAILQALAMCLFVSLGMFSTA